MPRHRASVQSAPTKYVEKWAPWTSTSDEASTWISDGGLIPAEEVEKATAAANAKGIDQSIKDGIDQAVPSERPFRPSVKRMVVFGFFGGFGLSLGVVIGGVIVGKIRRAMRAYRERSAGND